MKLIAGALIALTTNCTPLPDLGETEKLPPCSVEVMVLDHMDDRLNCDLIPPMTLAAHLDDDYEAFEACHDAGGQVMRIDSTDQFFCINLDY